MTDSLPLGRRTLFALVGLLVASACGGAAAVSPSPAPGIAFTMTAQNHSGASGTGMIKKTNDSFTVSIKITGLQPGSSHISHIHLGKCGQPGAIAFALSQVVADSTGVATATTTVPVEYSVPASGWYVNVHHGPDFTDADYAPSDSCGDLSAS